MRDQGARLQDINNALKVLEELGVDSIEGDYYVEGDRLYIAGYTMSEILNAERGALA